MRRDSLAKPTSITQHFDLLTWMRTDFWPLSCNETSGRAASSRATDRLQRLVESLLDFGRMEAGSNRRIPKVYLSAIYQ